MPPWKALPSRRALRRRAAPRRRRHRDAAPLGRGARAEGDRAGDAAGARVRRRLAARQARRRRRGAGLSARRRRQRRLPQLRRARARRRDALRGGVGVPRQRRARSITPSSTSIATASCASATGSDGKPGFSGMEALDAQSPDGFYLVWTPGQPPTPPVDGQAWRIDRETDLVVQLHLQPTGKPETVQPTIGLYFADRAPTVAARDGARGRSADRHRAGRALHHARRDHAAGRRRRAGAVSASALSRAHRARARAICPTAASARSSPSTIGIRRGRTSTCWRRRCVAGGHVARDRARLRQQRRQSAQSARAAGARADRRAHRRRDGQRDVRAAPRRASATSVLVARDEVSARGRARRRGARLVQPRQHARRGAALRRGDRGLSARAWRWQPSLLPAQANLGRALFVSGDVAGAVRAYEAALALDPHNARVEAMLARGARDESRRQSARRLDARSRRPACAGGSGRPSTSAATASSRSCVVGAGRSCATSA